MNIETFLAQFNTPPKSISPQVLLQKARHWRSILEAESPNTNPYELAHRRRLAKQNLKRLLVKHPELLRLLEAEVQE